MTKTKKRNYEARVNELTNRLEAILMEAEDIKIELMKVKHDIKNEHEDFEILIPSFLYH